MKKKKHRINDAYNDVNRSPLTGDTLTDRIKIEHTDLTELSDTHFAVIWGSYCGKDMFGVFGGFVL